MSDFGQIHIFNITFPYKDVLIHPSLSPEECLTRKATYMAQIGTTNVPIMIGSDIHIKNHGTHINPLEINGYFIVEGICKSINNVKIERALPVTHNFAILPSNNELHIRAMGEYYLTPRRCTDVYSKKYRWYLPSNISDIAFANGTLSKREKLDIYNHLMYAAIMQPKFGNICKDELTLLLLNTLFGKWIKSVENIKDKSRPNLDINTPAETMKRFIQSSANRHPNSLIDAMKTNRWKLGPGFDFPLSDNMHHSNIVEDIEAVRRITLIGDRDHMPSERRCIKDSELGLVCPVHTSSGSLTGTVSYIATSAKVMYSTELTNTKTINLSETITQCNQTNKETESSPAIYYNGKWILPNSVSSISTKVKPKSNADSIANKTNSLSLMSNKTEEPSDIDIAIALAENKIDTRKTTTTKTKSYTSAKYLLLYTMSNGATIYAMWSDSSVLVRQGKQQHIISCDDTKTMKDIVSYSPSFIPYMNYNPAIRAMFACSMIKHAISLQHPNRCRLVGGKSLCSAEQPLVGTPFPAPMGHNLLVGIMPWFGYNVEDAIVLSKAAATKYASITYETQSYKDVTLLYAIVNSNFKNNNDCNSKICEDIALSNGDLLAICLVDGSPLNIYANFNCNNSVVSYLDEFKYNMYNHSLFIRIAIPHYLELGDKMASRHGQKGVISKIEDTENMPYIIDTITSERKYLDLLINPHAFPSRMTMGQICEMGNKEETVYIPQFEPPERKVKNKIIVGPCFYMALINQVNDKVQYRTTGNIDAVTNQPSRNKHFKDGGLRFGLMERDLLLTIGAYATLSELWQSDKVTAYYCDICGRIYSSVEAISTRALTQCCMSNNKSVICNKSLLILISILRSTLKDIRWNPQKNIYAIKQIDPSEFISISRPNTKREKGEQEKSIGNSSTAYFDFGYEDVLDIRANGAMPILPCCIRSPQLDALYRKYCNATPKNVNIILTFHMSLLRGKHGIYHSIIEAHQVNNSLRSVIIPDPSLPLDTVQIPSYANIGSDVAIFNRQPSLSLDSFMAVNVIKNTGINDSNCIHMNPLICTPFTADIDGDEMVLYGISNEDSIKELNTAFTVNPVETQDYKFISHFYYCYPNKSKQNYSKGMERMLMDGLTMNKDDAMRMVEAKSKGSIRNYNHIYIRIGDIYVNGKVIHSTDDNYANGLTFNTWYANAKAAREAAVSISINTPYTGALYAKSMSKLL